MCMEAKPEAIALETEFANNLIAIENLNQRNRNLFLELVKLYHGVGRGDIVVYKGVDYKIDVIEYHDCVEYYRERQPWVHAFKQKKDGGWGIASQCLYTGWKKK